MSIDDRETDAPLAEREGVEHAGHEPLVDLGRTARRMRAVLVALGGLVLLAWLVTGFLGAGFAPRRLAEYVGFGLLVAFAAEVVIVGGAAVRGMLRAGERGHRLASNDVSLLPPQLARWLGGRRRG